MIMGTCSKCKKETNRLHRHVSDEPGTWFCDECYLPHKETLK